MLIFIQGIRNADLQKDLHMKRSADLNELVKEMLYLVDNCMVYKDGERKDQNDNTSSQDSRPRTTKSTVAAKTQ